MPPQSITFTLCTHIRCGGARRRFPTSADTPLAVRFTAITSKLSDLFFYQALPHLIYSLFRAGKLPVPITFTRGKARLLCTNLYCYARTSGAAAHSGGVPPQSITFTRGKTRLLCTNLYCYARTSGAAAHGGGFLRPPTRPLRCALRLLYQNLQVLFSIRLCRT